MGPVNPADCDAVKAKNVSIYVLYTTYTPLPYNPFYLNNIAQFLNQPSPNAVETALQACASSPANFFVATSPEDIDQALLAMLAASIRAPARFTM
jgi:Tfp pilus tip-associated adhesin PilY1